MGNKTIGIMAVIVFGAILSLPLYYNVFTSSSGGAPPLVKGKGEQCVRPAQWMRDNHMVFLMQTRDEVVREGIRRPDHGIQGCRKCHENRDEFCDRCHSYVGVEPECWNCHYYPTSTDRKIDTNAEDISSSAAIHNPHQPTPAQQGEEGGTLP